MADQHIPETLPEVIEWNCTSAHDRKKAIIYHSLRTAGHYMIVGKLLCDAEKGRDWKLDGSGAKNFFQWVENELGFKRTNAQRMMNIWETFSDFLKSPKIINLVLSVEFSKLAMIAPYMEGLSQEEQLELVHSAKENSQRALENNLREMRGIQPTDTCEHMGDRKILEICKVCGRTLTLKEVKGAT